MDEFKANQIIELLREILRELEQLNSVAGAIEMNTQS